MKNNSICHTLSFFWSLFISAYSEQSKVTACPCGELLHWSRVKPVFSVASKTFMVAD